MVDDGSTDATPEILQDYATDPRVTILRQDNQKLPSALNAGFARATGEFYTWTSADNIMEPACLSKLVEFLRIHPHVEMVYADEEIIDEHGRPFTDPGFYSHYQARLGSNRIAWPVDPGRLNFVQDNYIGGCFLYRAWAAKLIGGYDPEAFGFEDYDYWVRMNGLFRIAHWGERRSLYRYRLHSGSLTARRKELRIDERLQSFLGRELARRNSYLATASVTLIGADPWTLALARIYKRAGYRVSAFESLSQASPPPRVQEKSLAIFGQGNPLRDAERFFEVFGENPDRRTVLLVDTAVATDLDYAVLERFDCLVAVGSEAWRRIEPRFGENAILAGHPEAIAYPLIAFLNASTSESM